MPGQRLRQYLDSNNIRYVSIMHSPAYTAQGIANSAHISGKEIAKTVILKMKRSFFMAVLPANRKINFDSLRKSFSDSDISLAGEDDFKDIFPDCEIGAMPPFGNLYNMEVYVSNELSRTGEIAFNAGTHSELIQMEYSDFERLVKPKYMDFTY